MTWNLHGISNTMTVMVSDGNTMELLFFLTLEVKYMHHDMCLEGTSKNTRPKYQGSSMSIIPMVVPWHF